MRLPNFCSSEGGAPHQFTPMSGAPRRCSEPKPSDSLRDQSNIIGGWLRSLTIALVVITLL